MITNKYISKIVVAVMAIAVCLCLCAMYFSDSLVSTAGGTGVKMEYETELFDTSEIISVNIIMDDADWDDMLSTATSEVYYKCDVEVNGKMFYSVGIRPKGNTSLSSIASDPDTDRFSLKLEFDQYVEGQTCFGLDKLLLNNNYADATNMKEALIYDMYQYLGTDASLYNYAKISLNGEYWGVYLALEAVEDSFLLRNYGVESGELYKPDSMDMGNMGAGDFDSSKFGVEMPEGFDLSQFGGEMPEGFDLSQFQEAFTGRRSNANGDSDASGDAANSDEDSNGTPAQGARANVGGGFGGFSMGGNGSNLNYTDDELDSYSTIWDSEVADSSKSDHRRVIRALKNIAEGTDLEEYMDIDNLLKYMAVHVFSVNDDSLSGIMAHNYYLYEYDGKLNLLPWDYNLAFGGMGLGSGATGTINDAIDNAFSGTAFFDTLMENEEYHEQYYAYLQLLVDEYINSGRFDVFYNRVRSQIDSLVESDPTAFYSYDEYLTAVATLYQVVQLRGESISGQIEGSIPSTESEQRSSDALIDASAIDLSVMGSMNMGDGMRDYMNIDSTTDPTDDSGSTTPADSANPSPSDQPSGDATSQNNSNGSSGSDSSPSGRGMPEGFDPSQFDGEMPEGFDPSQFDGEMPEGFDPSQFDGEMPEGFDASQFGGSTQADGQSEEADSQESLDESQDRGAMPNGFDMSNIPGMSSGSSSSSNIQNLVTYGVCFAVLLLALLFGVLYKRKPRKR